MFNRENKDFKATVDLQKAYFLLFCLFVKKLLYSRSNSLFTRVLYFSLLVFGGEVTSLGCEVVLGGELAGGETPWWRDDRIPLNIEHRTYRT